MKPKEVKHHSLGYHKPWQKIIGRKTPCPDHLEVGPKCDKRGHHFMGKSVYRVGANQCIQCDADLATPRKKPPAPKPTPELVARVRQFKERQFAKEMAGLEKGKFEFSHLA